MRQFTALTGSGRKKDALPRRAHIAGEDPFPVWRKGPSGSISKTHGGCAIEQWFHYGKKYGRQFDPILAFDRQSAVSPAIAFAASHRRFDSHLKCFMYEDLQPLASKATEQYVQNMEQELGQASLKAAMRGMMTSGAANATKFYIRAGAVENICRNNADVCMS